ncbi:MAG: DUF2179 domain-containing protein [Fibromonadaceae bacterium]|jgi:uncharacterized protein YebE (UPF0316 family)|nr:DUF2179 domain-containing protein [Fibromonadaceae bacterium]
MYEIIQAPPWVIDWILFPLLVILARICDVSLGTMRIILVGKGQKNIAPFIGFIEILIWIAVVSQIIQNLDKIQLYFAFALGYALGVFIGIKIENRLSIGQLMIRIISNHDSSDLLKELKNNNFNFTTTEATGKFGPVKIIYIIIQRHLLKKTTRIIEASNNSAFYTIEDVRYVKGNLPGGRNPILNSLNPFHRH